MDDAPDFDRSKAAVVPSLGLVVTGIGPDGRVRGAPRPEWASALPGGRPERLLFRDGASSELTGCAPPKRSP